MKRSFVVFSLLLALGATAQDLNTEITVNHEVVPEEQAATRMRWLPTVNLPAINAGRLPMASNFIPATLTPFINPLDAAQYADTLVSAPWRGYAMLGYGPIYNLDASVGYRFIQNHTLTLDGFLQFNGISYTSGYPEIDYDGKVCLRRNTVLAGLNSIWNVGNGHIDASAIYQFSGFNFPILDLPTLQTDKHQIDANVAKICIGWRSHVGEVSYNVRHDYDLISFGAGGANNNRFHLSAGLNWKASYVSSWLFDAGFSLDHSSLVGNKGIVHLLPAYSFNRNNITLKVGLDVDVTTGNNRSGWMLVAPDLNVSWQAWTYVSVWAKINGRIDDNARISLFDEQPYLLPDFDTGFSKIYNGEFGLTFGPFRGARIGVFGGYVQADDWYIPALTTGEMTAEDVKGWHGGAELSYNYRHYLSVSARAELAESPSGNYSRGYAPWRDHAQFNLTANATVRPVSPLEITVGYHLRTGRQKQLPAEQNMNLRTISNLQASVAYKFSPACSAFLRGENILNKRWYLGPAVPSQGIMGMIGVSYKF